MGIVFWYHKIGKKKETPSKMMEELLGGKN
jgi:hypothetical protein